MSITLDATPNKKDQRPNLENIGWIPVMDVNALESYTGVKHPYMPKQWDPFFAEDLYYGETDKGPEFFIRYLGFDKSRFDNATIREVGYLVPIPTMSINIAKGVTVNRLNRFLAEDWWTAIIADPDGVIDTRLCQGPLEAWIWLKKALNNWMLER